MKITIVVLCIAVCPLFFFACGTKSAGDHSRKSPDTDSVRSHVVTAETFTAPPDSTISRARFAAWFACNPKLDSLSYRFSETFSSLNNRDKNVPAKEHAFSAAQDSVCLAGGLRGGYREYRWIQEHLGMEKNRKVYDSLRKGG
jgi:hypothetical protein